MEIFFDVLGVVFLWLAVEYCLQRETADSLDEASMVPFADDPEVARRVELATGKTVKAVAISTRRATSGSSANGVRLASSRLSVVSCRKQYSTASHKNNTPNTFKKTSNMTGSLYQAICASRWAIATSATRTVRHTL